MNWVNVNLKLPDLDYNWILVTDGDHRIALARYAHKNINKSLIETWEFFETNDSSVNCPYAGDCNDLMDIDDIKYWMDIWTDLPSDKK